MVNVMVNVNGEPMKSNGLCSIAAVAAILLAACTSSDGEPTTSGTGPDAVQSGPTTGTVCQLEDTFDLNANRIAPGGVDRASDDFGVSLEVRTVTAEGDGAAEMQRFVER